MGNVIQCDEWDDPGAAGSCTRLVAPLEDVEELPDHVCHSTMFASCSNWLGANWPDWMIPAPPGKLRHDKILYLTPELKLTTRGLHDWPHRIYMDAGCLHLVVRQWVEGRAEQHLATEIESHSSFNMAVNWFREYCRSNPHEAERNLENSIHGNSSVMNRLAELGFPCTPCTVRYFISRSQGKTPQSHELPSRGVLVTTFCILPIQVDEDEQGNGLPDRKHGETAFTITGSSTWATSDILERAAKRVIQHRDWWKRQAFAGTLSVDLKRRNKGHSTACAYTEDITSHLNGSITRENVVSRQIKRESLALQRSLTVPEVERVQRRIARAIQRKQQSLKLAKHDND